MIKNGDGYIILDDDDARGIDALIATLDIHVKGERSYTIQEASKFVREWEYTRRPHTRNCSEYELDDDEC